MVRSKDSAKPMLGATAVHTASQLQSGGSMLASKTASVNSLSSAENGADSSANGNGIHTDGDTGPRLADNAGAAGTAAAAQNGHAKKPESAFSAAAPSLLSMQAEDLSVFSVDDIPDAPNTKVREISW